MSAADLIFLLLAVHSALGLVSGALVAFGAVIEARDDPRAFATRRQRFELCLQIFLVSLIPVVMWALSAWLRRRRS